jgi:hypothetical protein
MGAGVSSAPRKFHIIQPVVEPEDAVLILRVDVEVELLQVLEQDPAVALDDRLRQAGGPDEYRTQSGWSNGTCSNRSSAPSPVAKSSAQVMELSRRERSGAGSR